MILSGTGISKSFMGVKALCDVSLMVEEGEILGIIGPNGSGKTTLFNILSGLERCDAGEVTLAGKRVSGLPSHRIAGMGLGRTFQNLRPFSGLSVLENVMAGGHLRAPTGILGQILGLPSIHAAERQARLDALQLLAEVGLGAYARSRSTELSYGQTKRLELARALNTRPRVLLLDEPTAGMNDVQAAEILDLVGAIKRKLNLTLVVIEHNVPVLMRFADRLMVLDAGCKLTEGEPRRVVADPRVIEAYLGRGA
ncbi:ABC transporter ATP-binding protein [Labrys monachus]|uniref:Branched-chain amino acid transport system ATP-binding protein n=1 Tax=Labrys monachus TaxID=217067 RepID=A0ABU0F807_9HYPH|nr:ABC transporter ATP-binding protein [Labrys monachus]MDQ0390497.1 branched-chain amino acid transport system ATP-binding protein [Labrys monachus]